MYDVKIRIFLCRRPYQDKELPENIVYDCGDLELAIGSSEQVLDQIRTLVLGVADDDLQPVGIEPEGVLLVSGPPASGRSTAVEMLARSSAAALPSSERYYFGNAKSSIGSLGLWHGAATTIDAAAALARAKELAAGA